MNGNGRHNVDRRESYKLALIEEFKAVVRHELEDRASLKKNGHTLAQWLGKVFTVDRVILGFVAGISVVYSFGGDVREYRRNLSEAVTAARLASETAKTAASLADNAALKSAAASEETAKIRVDLSAVVVALNEQTATSKAISNKVAMSITRPEFDSAIKQQILPRLARIEKQLGTQP